MIRGEPRLPVLKLPAGARPSIARTVRPPLQRRRPQHPPAPSLDSIQAWHVEGASHLRVESSWTPRRPNVFACNPATDFCGRDYMPNALRRCSAASSTFFRPPGTTPMKRKLSWISPGYCEYVTGTPAAFSLSAYALPSSRSGSTYAVFTSAGGRPERSPLSGDACVSAPCSGVGR